MTAPPGRRSRPATNGPAKFVEKALTHSDVAIVPDPADDDQHPACCDVETSWLCELWTEREAIVRGAA